MESHILIADDELHIRRAAEYKLKRCGYQVTAVADGEEAWDEIMDSRPDLLVTDLQMPRLNGQELIKRIRETPEVADLPVIMLTAKGFELPQWELINTHRVLDVISKPFSPRELCKRVQMGLEDARRRLESGIASATES